MGVQQQDPEDDLRDAKRIWTRHLMRCAALASRILHPRVCMRLEELMGTNLVRITDRGYMRMLHQRIQEDYTKQQADVMAQRMDEEIEREKKLVLDGKMTVEEASKELLEHPVFKASQLTKQLIEKRRADIRKGYLPKCKQYYGPEAEPEEEEEAEEEEQEVEVEEDELAREKKKLLQEVDEISDEYMTSQKDYERLKYESPLVKQLKELQSVDEMYEMAEKIVGTFEGPGDNLDKESESDGKPTEGDEEEEEFTEGDEEEEEHTEGDEEEHQDAT